MPVLQQPNGSKLSYREDGSGPPLVLVHGSPGDARSWARVLPFLKDRFRILSVDLPGYGGSDPVPDDPVGRTALMASPIARLIETCGQAVRFAGHSYGGNVTLHALLQAKSGAVESVVLFEPVFGRALHLTDDAAIGPLEAHFEDYCRRALAGEEGAVGRMVDYWFGAGAYVRLPDPVRGYLNANARRNALDVLSGFKDETATDQLAALGTPIRVVYGDRSPDIVQAIGRSLLKLLPDARMEALAGANHGMLDSHPEAVARLIAA